VFSSSAIFVSASSRPPVLCRFGASAALIGDGGQRHGIHRGIDGMRSGASIRDRVDEDVAAIQRRSNARSVASLAVSAPSEITRKSTAAMPGVGDDNDAMSASYSAVLPAAEALQRGMRPVAIVPPACDQRMAWLKARSRTRRRDSGGRRTVRPLRGITQARAEHTVAGIEQDATLRGTRSAVNCAPAAPRVFLDSNASLGRSVMRRPSRSPR